MVFCRLLPVLLLGVLPVRADDVLFIGNSFTYGGAAPIVEKNGGVPKLVEGIAQAAGKNISTTAVTKGGKDWAYHLAQPITEKTISLKPWTWIVLQDYSTRPTRVGNIDQFMKDGKTFSDLIAKTSPKTGIVLYETWARPVGKFYSGKEGKGLSGPEQMMGDLHQSYDDLQKALAETDADRPVRVALVGTAFAKCNAQFPAINLSATDNHHASADGYYLAALVIYETLFHDSVKDAPTQFFNGALTIPAEEADDLQAIADEVAGSPVPAK